MAIRTIYEISKPSYKFYSVERAGFTSVTEMASSAVTDCLQLGSFTLSNVHFIHTQTGARVDAISWPVLETVPVPSTVSPGEGYQVNDILEIPGNYEANLKIKVTKTFRSNGAVRAVSVLNAGDQRQLPAEDKVTRWPDPSLGSTTLTYSATFTVQGNVVNQSNLKPTSVDPYPGWMFQLSPNSTTNPWFKAFGNDGSEGAGNFSAAGIAAGTSLDATQVPGSSRWPQNGFWTADHKFIDKKILVGQEVILRGDAADLPDHRSVIQPDTFITGVFPIKVVTGITSKPAPGITTGTVPNWWKETTEEFLWISTSKPVTVYKGDPIGVRGTKLKINDTKTQLPAGFTAILEGGGAVDPLSDTVGVRGNVAQITNNSKYVLVNNLVTENTYNPYIYAGQEVTSTNPLGTIGPAVDKNAVTVISVNSTGPTSANVELSEPITFSTAGESLNFVFGEPQPWRVAFEAVSNKTNPSAGSQTLNVYAATSLQLTDTGKIADIWNVGGTAIVDRAGMMGNKPTGTAGAPNTANPDEGFLNREKRVGTNPEVYPLNYQLTLTDRGMFFGLWEGTWSVIQKTKARSTSDKDAYFNWFVIQRPVNRYTGAPLTVGRCPVFCINSVGYKYWKFVVREEDVLHPQQGDPDNKRDYINATGAIVQESTPYRIPADSHTQDSYAILNTTNQISLTEDSKYLISFVHNLTSPRFRYSEEIDMIGQTSADVCMAGNDLSITSYNESGPRIYRALPSNNPYNTGLRVVALRDVTWLGA